MRQFNVVMGDAEVEALEWLRGWVMVRLAIANGPRELEMMRRCHYALAILFSGEIPVTTDQGTHGGAHGAIR